MTLRTDPTERDAPAAIAAPTGDFEAYAYEGGALRLLVRGPDRDAAMKALGRLGTRVGALVQGGTLLRGHNAHDRAVVARLEKKLAELRAGVTAPALTPESAPQVEPAPASLAVAKPRRAARVDPEHCARCDEPAPRHLSTCPEAATAPPPRPTDDPRHWPAPTAPIVVRRASEPPPAQPLAPPTVVLASPPQPKPATRPSPTEPVRAVAPVAEAPRPPCEASDCRSLAAPVTERTHPETACFCRRHRQTAYERARDWGCSLAAAAQTVKDGTCARPAAPAGEPAVRVAAAPRRHADTGPRPTCEAKDCDRARGRIQRNTHPLLAPFCNEDRRLVNDRSRYLVGGVAAAVAMLREGTLTTAVTAPPPVDALCTRCERRPQGILTTKTPPGGETCCGPCRRELAMAARGTSRRPKHTTRGLKRGQRPTELRAAAPHPAPDTTPTTETTMPRTKAKKTMKARGAKATARPRAPQPGAAVSVDDFVASALAPVARALRVVERLGGIARAEKIADAIEVA